MEHLGSNAFRSEDFPEIFLSEVASLHEMVKSLPGTGLGDGIAALLVSVNQDSQQFGKFFFFRRESLDFIQPKQFTGEALAFVIRTDDMRKRPPQQLPVCFL